MSVDLDLLWLLQVTSVFHVHNSSLSGRSSLFMVTTFVPKLLLSSYNILTDCHNLITDCLKFVKKGAITTYPGIAQLYLLSGSEQGDSLTV